MKIYKELETLNFFKWYCTQYGGLVYQEYKTVYDDLPLDNIIRTELNACVFKFFREKYNINSWIQPFTSEKSNGFLYLPDESYSYFIFKDGLWVNDAVDFLEPEEAELECLKKLIEIVKK